MCRQLAKKVSCSLRLCCILILSISDVLLHFILLLLILSDVYVITKWSLSIIVNMYGDSVWYCTMYFVLQIETNNSYCRLIFPSCFLL